MADNASRRINSLIQEVLVEVSSSDDGWSVLYLDNEDGRYWELTYPQSTLHGGGPPCLTAIPVDEASKRYVIRS